MTEREVPASPAVTSNCSSASRGLSPTARARSASWLVLRLAAAARQAATAPTVAAPAATALAIAVTPSHVTAMPHPRARARRIADQHSYPVRSRASLATLRHHRGSSSRRGSGLARLVAMVAFESDARVAPYVATQRADRPARGKENPERGCSLWPARIRTWDQRIMSPNRLGATKRH
jgi:hypothetical protein